MWLTSLAQKRKSGPILDDSIGELEAFCRLASRSSAEHPNVVPLIEAMVDDDYLYLIMPYCQGGDLFDVIDSHPFGLEDKTARLYLKQTIHGLLHLKRHGLAHG